MSESVRLIYDDSGVQLEGICRWLEGMAEDGIVCTLFPARTVSLPVGPAGEEFARKFPGVYPRRAPSQITVTDKVTGASVFIMERDEIYGPIGSFVIFYSVNERCVSLLKKLLHQLLGHRRVWIRVLTVGNPFMAYGPDWVEMVETHPRWYWGYSPGKTPDTPFVDCDETKVEDAVHAWEGRRREQSRHEQH